MEKLFNVLNIDLSKLKNLKLKNIISLFNNNNFTKTELHVHNHIHVEKNKLTGINYEALDETTKKMLLEVILSQDGVMITPTKTYERLESAKKYIAEPKTETLKYFEDKLPQAELNLLRSADYIKRTYEAGKTSEIQELKRQLVDLYGQKANVVCNLYTAGYFDSFLRQKYEDLSVLPGFKSSDFYELYNELISDFPVAIFVYHTMSEDEVEMLIREKVSRLRESKLGYLNIHGIGDINIKKIESVLKSLEDEELITGSSVDKTSKTIVLRLTLRI